MDIAIIGSGYVGLVAGACFADSGNEVICVDKDESKINALHSGQIPIYEPGLSDIVKRNVGNKRLSFTTSLKEGVEKSEIVFIAVGTPQGEDGSADLRHVLAVAEEIGKSMNGRKVIVDKSTVPVGTAQKVRETISKFTDHEFDVVSNPEFLKEGAAIDDFMKPDRVVVGADSDYAAQKMKNLYSPFVRTNKPILIMDVASAEMTKYAANAMLATRISFMNEIANLCEKVGADVSQVRIGVGTDSRIGMSFLFPGIGYGGSCFPKDVQALIKTGQDNDCDLHIAQVVEKVNFEQKKTIIHKIVDHFGGQEQLRGKKIALWGLAFKPKTDDIREAPALVVASELAKLGAQIQAFDPVAIETFSAEFSEPKSITYAETNYDALQDVSALVLCTEWNDFRHPNLDKMKSLMNEHVIFDGRNLFSLEEMEESGFTYYSVGRKVIRA